MAGMGGKNLSGSHRKNVYMSHKRFLKKRRSKLARKNILEYFNTGERDI